MNSTRWMVLILILAAALRLFGLGSESLWLDETLTLKKIAEPLPTFVRSFENETQTILYYFVEKLWCGLAGTGEWAVRFPSVVYGTVAVWGTFLLASALFSPAVGVFAALFMAVNPFAIYYSQEARPYALFLAGAVFSIYFLLKMLRHGTGRSSIGYVISTAVALYSHPLAPLVWGVHTSALLLKDVRQADWRGSARRLLRVIGISALLYVPQVWLISAQVVAKTRGKSDASWIPIPTLDAIPETVKQYFMHPLLALAVMLVIVAVVIAVLFKQRRLPSALWIPAALVVFCIIAPWVISHALTPIYVVRYTIPALASFVIALAWVISQMGRWLRAAAAVLLMALTALALFGYYTGMDKESWRQTAEELRALVRPGDLIAVSASYTHVPLRHYYHPPENVQVIAPWKISEIPVAVDTNSRIVRVKSYDLWPNKTVSELDRRVASGRFIVSDRLIAEGEKRNPWAYWLMPIRVTLYAKERMKEEG